MIYSFGEDGKIIKWIYEEEITFEIEPAKN
jgi:hypothetical protein